MAFPTIPTVAAGRVLTAVQANTTAARTFPSLTGLTKNSGDLLIAIVVCYQSSAASGYFSTWGGGFTEFGDFGTSSTMCIGAAYKWSTGSETGTFDVTQAATITGHAALILLSIPGAHATTPPEGGSYASGTTAAADPASFDPAGWAAEDVLWIAVGGAGETGTTGAFTGAASAPTSYGSYAETGISADVVGGVEGGVGFRQLNASAENVGTWGVDTSNARNAAVVIAVRPAAAATVERAGAIDAALGVASAATFFSVFERQAATDAATGISTVATFFTVFERVAAVDALVGIATAGQFLSVLERAVAVDAAVLIATAGQVVPAGPTVYERSALMDMTAGIASAATFLSVFERASAVDAAVWIATSGEALGVTERAAAVEIGVGVSTRCEQYPASPGYKAAVGRRVARSQAAWEGLITR